MSPEIYRKGYHAGYTEIATALNEKYPDRQRQVTRQSVHQWSVRRERNGFPPGLPVTAPSGKIKNVFLLEDVLLWFEGYTPSRGGGHRPVRAVDNN